MRPILHHYAASPWAELVRLALGLKGLAWGSVEVPAICPKPEQEALTGGYVRTPVMQIGADVFCDTLAILDALEARWPEPTLYPEPLGRGHRALAIEAGGATFLAAVGVALGPMAEAAPTPETAAFWADRERRFGLKPEAFRAMLPALREAFATHLERLEGMLADGRPYLGGDAPGHGDLAHAMLLWFAARGAPVETVSEPLAPWAARVLALGHGAPQPMSGAEALAEARACAPSVLGDGPRVRVSQAGSADPPVEGRLVHEDADGFTLLREGDEVGLVAVHFPREGQILARV